MLTAIPARNKYVAQASPAGPAPITATFFLVVIPGNVGLRPFLKPSSEINVSIAPMVIAPCPSLSVQSPSQRRSCGQIRPVISGYGLVSLERLKASSLFIALVAFNQNGI